jgi:hypothetical protein
MDEPPTTPRRATIRHVSQRAGVSIKTVSRVLNNERYVGADTRARVQEAVAALNFRPNLAARSLAGRRSFQIALVCDNPSPNYVYAMQTGIRDRCEADGVRMIAQPYDRASQRLVEEVEALLDASRPDGVVLTPPASDDAATGDRSGPIVEAVMPDVGEDRALARLIEPLSGTVIARANTNYDAGVSLEELLAYEGKLFDTADTDHDGYLSMEELRPKGKDGERMRGPGGPGPMGGPPPR